MKNIQQKGTAKSIKEYIENTTNINIEDLDKEEEYNIKYIDDIVKSIKEDIQQNRAIRIIGDYDVDGITSSAIMYLALSSLGADVKVRIPYRLTEGYGANEKIIDEFENENKDISIITVDNGIVAFDAINKAKNNNMKVYLTDHHLPSEEIPKADIVIDPHIKGTADFEDYCGAGIAYKICEKLITDKELLAQLESLAAMGTICDMMPLIKENRKIVKEGLENIRNGKTVVGLKILLDTLETPKDNGKYVINEEDIKMKIGPMINAPGRLENDGANKPLTLLTRNNPIKTKLAEEISKQIIETNEKRKELTNEYYKKLKETLESMKSIPFPIVYYNKNLPEGLAGLLAGKIAKEYDTPTFIFTNSEDANIRKGSARTAANINIKELLDKIQEDVKLEKCGGHEGAAGISVTVDNYRKLGSALMKNCFPPLGYVQDETTYYDIEITADKIPKAYEELEKYRPFGEGIPEPTFLVREFNPIKVMEMGADKTHIRFSGPGYNYNAVGFNKVQDYKEINKPKKLDFIGRITGNYYNGNTTPQLMIDKLDEYEKEIDKNEPQYNQER